MSGSTPIHSCVSPEGKFVYGIHKPEYGVSNLRHSTKNSTLGSTSDGVELDNRANFPIEDIQVDNADWIFEIRNPFTFRGATFIDKEWADNSADNYSRISIPQKPKVSLHETLKSSSIDRNFIDNLPEPLLLSLATTSTDEKDLIRLAHISCEFSEKEGELHLLYNIDDKGNVRPVIHNHLLFEAVANNPYTPEQYKICMVIRPGAQGKSEIVGDFVTHRKVMVYEYLRRNSYIGGGHYAANFSDENIRYSIQELGKEDIHGLRFLYYQRTFIRLAECLNLSCPKTKDQLTPVELESLREEICQKLQNEEVPFLATLWGWNFGFDYAPTKYRLHASHQQIHQQYAMLPTEVELYSGKLHSSCGSTAPYGCGELITKNIREYRNLHGQDFFTDYLKAIRSNKRMDERDDLESSLIVWEDENVMLFVPKAQTSQWELQLMTIPSATNFAGNIVEADLHTRQSIDQGILNAQRCLAGLGAEMVTTIEYPKPLRSKNDNSRKEVDIQPLIYCFLPRLPESPGAFSEAQLRYINGHYPEDFAAVCRNNL